jgi:NTE family protein
MSKQLAFVLSGGAARGALQVGALRALLESNIRPDMLVGTSIGAVNAAYLAMRGVSLESISRLAENWGAAAQADLLPSNYLWVTLSALFNRSGTSIHYHRMRDFFIAHGLTPDFRFGDIQGVRLIIVAADLNCGCAVIYGPDPHQSVLEAVLASAALPPWIPPLAKDGQLLIDGGAVSNLPVEPALAQGATEIIALDLTDSRDIPSGSRNWPTLLLKLMNMAEQRQMELEVRLAEARGVPVRRIVLQGESPVAIWDFHRVDELVARGYDIACREIASWSPDRPSRWRKWLARLKRG